MEYVRAGFYLNQSNHPDLELIGASLQSEIKKYGYDAVNAAYKKTFKERFGVRANQLGSSVFPEWIRLIRAELETPHAR